MAYVEVKKNTPFKGEEGRLQHPRRAPSSSKKGVFFNLKDGRLVLRR